MREHPVAVLCIGVALLALASRAPLRAADNDVFRTFNTAEVVLKAEIYTVRQGPMRTGIPPMHSMTIELDKAKALRGKAPERLSFMFSVSAEHPPLFPEDMEVYVALVSVWGAPNMVLRALEPVDKETTELVEAAVSLPAGWTTNDDGEPLSPWAGIEGYGWAGPSPEGAKKCAVTGRPAVGLPAQVEFTVRPIVPQKVEKFVNPDGDGIFAVAVRNTGKEDVTLDALLTDGERVYWRECLVVLNGNRPVPFLNQKGAPEGTRPVVLKPGEALAAQLNLLTLGDLKWPRGGARLNLRVALGDRAAVASFYYRSEHHDRLRNAAQPD